MVGIVKKITSAIRARSTYRFGLIQTKAYRILKSRTDKALERYDITSVHWALLGLLNDVDEGMRYKDLAGELGVEAPFVTALFAELKALDMVDARAHDTDSRTKIIFLTEKGKVFVKDVEAYLRGEMRVLVGGVSPRDLLSYLHVLEKIIENDRQRR